MSGRRSNNDNNAVGYNGYNYLTRPAMITYVADYVSNEVPNIVRRRVTRAVEGISSLVSPRVLGYTHKMSTHLDDIADNVSGECYWSDRSDFNNKTEELANVFSTEKDIAAMNHLRRYATPLYDEIVEFSRGFHDVSRQEQDDAIRDFFGNMLGVAVAAEEDADPQGYTKALEEAEEEQGKF